MIPPLGRLSLSLCLLFLAASCQPAGEITAPTETATSAPPPASPESTSSLVAECSGTPGEWDGCRGHGCSVCGEVTAQYPYYFANHPLCDRNLTCAGQFFTCNANCPAPTDADREPAAGQCAGTTGQWLGCRGNGCSVCGEKLTAYPYYFLNHPRCLRNDTCAGQFFTCNSNCPAPTAADQAPPAGTCSGTPGQWSGCRGNGCLVCAEKLTDYPGYFLNHPNCVKNTTCAGAFGTCNSNCPAPTDADRVVPLNSPNPGPTLTDLPAQNTALAVETSGGIFRIKSLPTSGFNVINLVVASNDGKALEGTVRSGGGAFTLSGTSQTLRFRERGKHPIVFALALPSVRKVKLTWSVQDRVPASQSITRSTSTASGIVTAKYGFAADHDVDGDLTMKFTATDFTDGVVPAFKRFEHNPQGVRYPDRPDRLFGPSYDISAKPKTGKRIQVALPIPEVALLRGLDPASAKVLHYSSGTKTWSVITPDRVDDNYVYFTTTSFSIFIVDLLVDVAGDAWDYVTDGAKEVAVAIGTFVDGVVDGLRAVYKAVVNGLCSALEFRTYKNIFVKQRRATPPKLNLADVMNASGVDTNALKAVRDRGLKLLGTETGTASAIELKQWEVSLSNAEVLMADVLLASKAGTARRFSVKVTTSFVKLPWGARITVPTAYVLHDATTNLDLDSLKIFRTSSALLAAAPRVLSLLVECGGALGLGDEFSHTVGHVVDAARELARGDVGQSCREALMLPVDAVDWVTPDILTCAAEAAAFKGYYDKKMLGQYFGGDRDTHVLAASRVLNQLSVLLWADPLYGEMWGIGASNLRDQMHAFVGLTHQAYGDGNIPIKAQAGVAVWDLVARGDRAAFNTVKSWLEAKTGEEGGYAEGTGYLQYINEDVPYLFAALLRGGLITRADLPRKYKKSAEWLMAASPWKGQRPIEVDDGITLGQDFKVYGYLTGDRRYVEFDDSTLPSNVSATMRPLGLTAATLQRTAPPVLPDVSFSHGVGMVRLKAAGSDATRAAVSVIAEKGLMRTGGNGHDQQDNGSVTLTIAGRGPVIIDPGYNGFSMRQVNPCFDPTSAQCLGARFDAHNVAMTLEPADFHGEKANGLLTYGDIVRVMANQPNVHNLEWAAFELQVISGLVFAFTSGHHGPALTIWDEDAPYGSGTSVIDAHAGGADADLVGPLVQDLPGFAAHGLEVKHTSTAGAINRRFVGSFADQLWILDRVENRRTMWSRLNWSTTGPFAANALQIPAPRPAEDTILSWPENDGTQRRLLRRTQVGGSLDQAPAFLTAVAADGFPSPFTQVHCGDGAECAQRDTATGRDLVIVPHWGWQYEDCAFFNGLVTTGQIVFAHRDAGSQTWTLRLVGEESAALTTSLGVHTGRRADVLYQVGPTSVQAVYPDGTRRTLTVTANQCQTACRAPFADSWNQPLGSGGTWSQAWGDPVVDVASNRLRITSDDVVQRNAVLAGSYLATYQLTLSGGTIFTPAVYEMGTMLPSVRRNGSDMQFGGAAYGSGWSDTIPTGFAGQRASGTLTASVTTYVKAQAKQIAMKVRVGNTVYRSGWSAPFTWAQTNAGIFRFIGQNLPGVYAGADDHVYVGPIAGCASYTDDEVQALYDGP